MSIINGVPRCDGDRECPAPITHIDHKGFVYCAEHGARRKQYQRCRKLVPWEVRFIYAAKPLPSYTRRPMPKAAL